MDGLLERACRELAAGLGVDGTTLLQHALGTLQLLREPCDEVTAAGARALASAEGVGVTDWHRASAQVMWRTAVDALLDVDRDGERQTGRTTRQMRGAPHGAVFIWCHSHQID